MGRSPAASQTRRLWTARHDGERVYDEELFDADGALSSAYLLARGYCCGLGCRNCPYEPRHGGADASPRTSGETLDPAEADESQLCD